MTLHLRETICISDKLLKRYRQLIDFKDFESQLLAYNPSCGSHYLSTAISCPTTVTDLFYYPVQSKRLGKTVAYLRCGKIANNSAETTVVWWADLLGAFSGEINFKD